jgi:type I restriction enzyme S subunit
MTLKPGYKQTEVGAIPEEWNVHKLRSCLSAKPDYGINAPAVSFSDKLPAYIRITDISADGRFSPETPVSVKHAEADRYYLNDGDIVFARTGASVGKSYLYNPNDGKLVFAGFLIRLRPDFAKLVPAYLAEYVSTGPYWNWVRLMSMRSGQPGINGMEYGQLPIPLPPSIIEQRAIAGALGDVDALIGALEKFIAKKRDLKQAAMQELLTGKKRLPGFSRKWKVKRLGEVLKVRHGKGQSEVVVADGIYPILASGGEIGRTNAFLYDKPSVLIGRKGTIDFPQYIDSPFWTIDTLFFTEISEEADPKFIFYKFNMINWKKYNEASGIPSLNASIIEAIEFDCPGKAEQTAIAAVLSDMDAEITALEARLAKTRALKQGMMQELLTGRIRLGGKG